MPVKKNCPISRDAVRAFLHYGYLPDPRPVNVEGLLDRYGIDLLPHKSKASFDALVEEGKGILDDVFRQVAGRVGEESVLIPLSGGLDSRGVLAGMLQHLPRRQIRTVTVGIPGIWDYEFGKSVAKKAGVTSHVINFNNVQWSEEELIDYASGFHTPKRLPLGFPHGKIYTDESEFSYVLSGFMGGITGGCLPDEESNSWTVATRSFAEENYRGRDTFDMETALSFLPDSPFVSKKFLSYDDQLDLFIRQRYHTRPLITRMATRDKFIAPYMFPEWIQFVLSLPLEMRREQSLYKHILAGAYPRLFSLPVKNNYGLSLFAPRWRVFVRKRELEFQKSGRKYLPPFFRRPPSRLEYIDFRSASRERGDLRYLTEKNLLDLHVRGLCGHIDIPAVWRQHQERKSNNAKLISLLLSLEIWLKAKGE